MIMNLFAFAITVTMPIANKEGVLFFYPIYTPTWLMNMFVAGSWVWVYFYTWFMDEFGNKHFGQRLYHFCYYSCLWGYLSHYLFIVIIARTIVRPYKLTLLWAIVVNFVGCLCLIIISYLVVEKCIGLCFKNRKQDQYK